MFDIQDLIKNIHFVIILYIQIFRITFRESWWLIYIFYHKYLA
jgi:hypothetical protein